MPIVGGEDISVSCWYHCREVAMGGNGVEGGVGLSSAEEEVLKAGTRRTSTLLKVLCMLVEEEEEQAKEEHEERRTQWEQEEQEAEAENDKDANEDDGEGDDGEGGDGEDDDGEERDSMGTGIATADHLSGNLVVGGVSSSTGAVVQCEQLKLKPLLHLLAPLHRPTVMGKCYREPLRKLTQLCLQAGLRQQSRAREEKEHEGKMDEMQKEAERRRREEAGEDGVSDSDSEEEEEDDEGVWGKMRDGLGVSVSARHILRLMRPSVWPLSESAEHQLVLVQELHSIVGDWELTPEEELQKFWKQLVNVVRSAVLSVPSVPSCALFVYLQSVCSPL
jgi:hypothetical protein